MEKIKQKISELKKAYVFVDPPEVLLIPLEALERAVDALENENKAQAGCNLEMKEALSDIQKLLCGEE